MAATLVDFAAVLYAMLAVLVERSVVIMFWALDKRREWRQKMRAEMREELRHEVKEEVRAAIMEEVRAAEREGAQAERDRQYEAWFVRLSREKGIPLEELLPKKEDLE